VGRFPGRRLTEARLRAGEVLAGVGSIA